MQKKHLRSPQGVRRSVVGSRQRNQIQMKAESQPSNNYPRYRKIKVGDVIRILQSCPRDAVIQCENGGFLEASEWSNWGEVEIIERLNRSSIVKTKWL